MIALRFRDQGNFIVHENAY